MLTDEADAMKKTLKIIQGFAGARQGVAVMGVGQTVTSQATGTRWY